MADLEFMTITNQIKDATYSFYDEACGTDGMLTVAQDRLLAIAQQQGKNNRSENREINPRCIGARAMVVTASIS